MSEEQLNTLYESELAKGQEEQRAKLEEREESFFFNTPAANADFDHWSRAAYWTLEEAIALSFGKDPARVNWRAISDYDQASRFPKLYARRLDLAKRAALWKKLFDPVLPGIFIGWARDNEIEFPAELESLVRARGNFIGSWKTYYDLLLEKHKALEIQFRGLLDGHAAMARERDEALAAFAEIQNAPAKTIESGCSAREKESLLKLIIGLAIGGYGYDPKPSRNTKAAEMASDLARAGVPLDADTIRKWLKMAAELLPPNETE